MDSRKPHGRQLKRTPGRQPILAKKESKDGWVPSGMWLEFAWRGSGKLKLSHQAARSIG